MKPHICGLVVAAGLSSRMGRFKPLLPLRGKTVIENTIDSVLAAGADTVVVVLGYRGGEVEAVLRGRYPAQSVKTVYNPKFSSTDMLTSVKIGAAALPACDAFFLMPGDMPVVSKDTFLAVLAARPETGMSVTFPTLGGYRKHPPLIDSGLIPEILAYGGAGGLRSFWAQHEASVATVAVDDIGCWTDLDTFEQYETCRRRFEAV